MSNSDSNSTALSLLGIGAFLPPRRVFNDEIAQLTGLPAEKIETLFGIRERRWTRSKTTARPVAGMHCSDMAVAAARNALADAQLAIEDIDTMIAVSSTSEYVAPPLDYLVAQKLKMGRVTGLTISAACSGVFRAMAVAEGFLRSGRSTQILIVASEASSPFFEFGPGVPKDQVLTSALFADAAAAIVVGGARETGPRISSIVCESPPPHSLSGIAYPGRMSAFPPGETDVTLDEYIGHHDFREVLSRGKALTRTAADAVLAAADIREENVTYFLTHQATGHLKDHAESIGIPPHKLPTNIDHVGNTVCASILILLDEMHRESRLKPGDLLVLHTAESGTWSYAGMAIHW